jgi:predicted Zn-dependent protease
LARIYLGQSRLKDAVAEIQKEPLLFWRQYGQALVFYAEGKKKESDSILHELTEAHQNDSAFQIAQIYAYRGETNKAFDWLDRALQQRDAGLTRLKGDQLLRSLERDPRYNPFLQKMKLPLD